MAYLYREQSIRLIFATLLFAQMASAQVNVALQLTNPSCGGFATGSIHAITNGGNAPYTYLWSNGSTANPILNVPAGTYTVTVTDFIGETATATGTLTEPPPLFVQIDVTDCGTPGAMAANVQGGVPPFDYEWSTGETTPAISNLQIDLYCLTVTDVNSCAFQTCEFIGAEIALTLTADTAFCGSGNGGSASVQVVGGVLPFKYEWNNGGTNDTIFDLPPGLYDVTVTTGNGCTEMGSEEVVLGPGDYSINFDNVNPGCSGSTSGSVTAIGEGGFEPYIYIWSTGDTAATVSNLPAGTYYVTAIDDYGCISIDSTILVTTSSIILSFSGSSPSCFGGTDGTATVTASNGAPPYSYLWVTGDSTPTIGGLNAGTYGVFVIDTLDCISYDSITLSDPPLLIVEATGSDVSACGQNDGTATATPSGGGNNFPYIYLWSNGDTTQIIDSLTAGLYSVTLTDANGCSARDSILIESPDTLDVIIDGTMIVCHGESNGELTAHPSHGTSPFTYLWSNGDTTQTIKGLAPGAYAATVTSSEGCIGMDSTKIDPNPPITISANVNNVTCFGFSNGSINVAIGGGTSPLSILWSNGSNSTIRNNLSAGNYPLTITDGVGCTRLDTISVQQPPPLNLSFNSSSGSCGTNGFSIAIVLGGTQPYTYQWSNGSTTSFNDNLSPGSYSVTITDAKNCQKTGTVIIPAYPPIIPNVTATNTTCNGTTDGTATASPVDGIAPYTYLWSNGNTTKTISNLLPGTYFVTVTDDVGCSATGSAQVMLGVGLNVTINGAGMLCPGQTGTLTAMASGGSPNYTYQWSNGATNQTIVNLNAGTYTVTVTDPNGCMGSATATITSGGNFTINSTFENVGCFGENTGRINLNVINAVPPVLYNWSNGVTTANNDNLPAGNYTVTVTDGSGCSKESSFSISQPNLLEVAVTGTDGTCGNLGSASSAVSGGTMPYFYLWSNGSTNPNLSILMPGTYTLTVTDAKGCKSTDTITIDVINSISCNILLVQPISGLNTNDGELSAMTIDGTPPFDFLWNNGKTTPTISDLSPGNYSVTVTDADNCVTNCSIALMNGARIGDFVWEDTNLDGRQDFGEIGLENVAIHLEGTNSYGEMVIMNTLSSPTGAYQFNVVPGDYQLTFNTPTGYVPSPNLQGSDANLDSDADPSTNKTPFFSILSGVDNQSIDAGFYVEITCDNVTNAGEICCNHSICAPGELPIPFTDQITPTGGTGTMEYMWMFSEQPGPFNPNTWETIPNSNSPQLSPGVLQQTTYFIRLARRSGCAQFLESNIVEVVVNNFPTPEVIGMDTLCINMPATFTTTDYGLNANYTWSFQNAVPDASNSLIASDIIWEIPGDYAVSVNIDVEGCPLVASSSVHITDHPDTCGYDLILNGELTDTMSVLLDWFYPESINVIRTYLVEWSHENGPYIPLGPPDSVVQTADIVHFFYTHDSPLPGTNYYRVTLNDSKGNQLISNIVAIEKDSVPVTGDYTLVHSFPNPFRSKIIVDVYDRFDNVPISIELINALGQRVYSAEIPTDMDRFEIATTSFPHGAYFLFVRYGGKPQKVFKLVK